MIGRRGVSSGAGGGDGNAAPRRPTGTIRPRNGANINIIPHGFQVLGQIHGDRPNGADPCLQRRIYGLGEIKGCGIIHCRKCDLRRCAQNLTSGTGEGFFLAAYRSGDHTSDPLLLYVLLDLR